MEIDPDPTPSLEQVEARVRELCRSAEIAGPDRVIEYDHGGYVALWDESKVALVVEVGREEL